VSSARLRILHVWDADYPWDVRVEKVSAALTAAGHAVTIVARNRAWRRPSETLPEGAVRRLPPWRWAGRRLDGWLSFPAFVSPRWYGHIARSARAVDADLILVRDIPLCATSIWAARARGIPVVLDMAENYPAMMRKNFEAKRARRIDYLVRNPAAVAAVERYCLPRLDRILVVVDENAARLHRLGVPPDRIALVSNTPPLWRAEAAVPARSGDAGGPLALVYIGILEVPRGLTELLDAVAAMRRRGACVTATIIGRGRDETLFRDHAARLGLPLDAIRFLGHVPSHEEALRIVAASDIGVLPHRASEAWNTTIPNKLFDYMAAALPIVTSDAIPFARIVRECEAGIVFRSGDAASLEQALSALADPARRRSLGANGRAAVRRRYHWEHDAATLVTAIEDAARLR
jgi:glycosyltransferase involved in cell wall biosynthesis